MLVILHNFSLIPSRVETKILLAAFLQIYSIQNKRNVHKTDIWMIFAKFRKNWRNFDQVNKDLSFQPNSLPSQSTYRNRGEGAH